MTTTDLVTLVEQAVERALRRVLMYPKDPLLVTVAEAARLLACTKSSIYRRVQQGTLTAVDRENAMRITTASIRAYIEREAR